jgi:hypothetical protein
LIEIKRTLSLKLSKCGHIERKSRKEEGNIANDRCCKWDRWHLGRQMSLLQTTNIWTIIENFSGSDRCYILGFWVNTPFQLFPSGLVLVLLISNYGGYEGWVCSKPFDEYGAWGPV